MPGKKAKDKDHPGFKAVSSRIAREQGIGQERADAILAAATRKAGPEARKRNPRLNRVAR